MFDASSCLVVSSCLRAGMEHHVEQSETEGHTYVPTSYPVVNKEKKESFKYENTCFKNKIICVGLNLNFFLP